MAQKEQVERHADHAYHMQMRLSLQIPYKTGIHEDRQQPEHSERGQVILEAIIRQREGNSERRETDPGDRHIFDAPCFPVTQYSFYGPHGLVP